MIKTGLFRKIDPLGRVTIPAGICHSIGATNNESYLDVWLQDNLVSLHLTEENSENATCSRIIDLNWRYVIPASIRSRLGLFPGAVVEFFLDGKTILAKRLDEHCKLCNSAFDLVEITCGHICTQCGLEVIEVLKNVNAESLKKAN